MFIVVRFGDDEQRLFNTNCRARILYENIKERCDCDSEDIIDLADENGMLKNLPNRPPDVYTTEFLTNRSTFILLRVNKEDNAKSYMPMLRGVTESNPDFIAKLYSRKVNPSITSGTQKMQSPSPNKPTLKGKFPSKSQSRMSRGKAR